jgi:hypothetical protein
LSITCVVVLEFLFDFFFEVLLLSRELFGLIQWLRELFLFCSIIFLRISRQKSFAHGQQKHQLISAQLSSAQQQNKTVL